MKKKGIVILVVLALIGAVTALAFVGFLATYVQQVGIFTTSHASDYQKSQPRRLSASHFQTLK
ncbi:MAG: hypothetical protein WAV32_04200 [Halobacteriota archaeon]